jgi:hypothetical protein
VVAEAADRVMPEHERGSSAALAARSTTVTRGPDVDHWSWSGQGHTVRRHFGLFMDASMALLLGMSASSSVRRLESM